MRESRRMQALYMLNENDVLSNRVFDDAVAYGGWPMDVHVGGLFNFDNPPSFMYAFPGCYTIPLRSFISRNVPNLLAGGRALGASKLAMSSALRYRHLRRGRTRPWARQQPSPCGMDAS